MRAEALLEGTELEAGMGPARAADKEILREIDMEAAHYAREIHIGGGQTLVYILLRTQPAERAWWPADPQSAFLLVEVSHIPREVVQRIKGDLMDGMFSGCPRRSKCAKGVQTLRMEILTIGGSVDHARQAKFKKISGMEIVVDDGCQRATRLRTPSVHSA